MAEAITETAPSNTGNRVAERGHASTRETVDSDCLLIIKVILALIFPPLAVALDRGCGTELLLNIILTIFGWLPGVAHAFFVIFHCGSSDADLEASREAPVIAAVAPANTTVATVVKEGETAIV